MCASACVCCPLAEDTLQNRKRRWGEERKRKTDAHSDLTAGNMHQNQRTETLQEATLLTKSFSNFFQWICQLAPVTLIKSNTRITWRWAQRKNLSAAAVQGQMLSAALGINQSDAAKSAIFNPGIWALTRNPWLQFIAVWSRAWPAIQQGVPFFTEGEYFKSLKCKWLKLSHLNIII